MAKHRINLVGTDVLYGRDAPLEELKEALRWAALGGAELVLVSGSAGVGKSSLVLQAFQLEMAGRCHFAWGKFDPYSSSKPYGALINCFQFLIRKLLTEPEAVLEQWKKRLRKAVGINCAVVTEVIPEAKWLLGEQAPLSYLPAKAAHNRFEWVFHQFVRAFTSADRPLVLFLDDLQWADRATLQLIDSLIADPQSQHLCVIGSFRSPPWEDNQDVLNRWLTTSAEAGYTLRHIQLEPLEMDDVHRLVCEVLNEPSDHCFSLAHTLFVKSIGNPLYVKQLLQAALDEGVVRYASYDSRDSNAPHDSNDSRDSYHSQQGRWVWDMERLYAFPGMDGQIEHLMKRITRLPALSKQTLVLASIVGNVFDLEMLSAVSHADSKALYEALELPIRAGLLAADVHRVESIGSEQSGSYRFTHDRIRQAAYEMMDDQERRQVHLRAALYIAGRKEQAVDPSLRLFAMTNHFNQAVALLDGQQREEVIRLNGQAAQQAMYSSDYETALSHLDQAIALLPGIYWQYYQPFTFRLHQMRVECRYLCGQYDRAEQEVEHLLQRAAGWLQRAQVIKLRVEFYSNMGKYARAIEWGLSALSEAGIHIDTVPNGALVVQEIQETKRLLSERMGELYTLQKIDDEEAAMRMELFVSLVGPAFFSNREVLAVVSSRFIRSVFQYGAPIVAPAVYGAFGMVLTTMVEDYAGGFNLGKVAVDLAERSQAPQVIYATHVMFYTVISSWIRVDPVDEERLWQASRLAVESGDYVYGSYAIGGVVNLAYGRCAMTELHQIARHCLPAAEATKEELVLKNVLVYMQLAEYLLSCDEHPLRLTAGFEDEEALLEQLARDEGGAVTLYQIYTYKTQISYLFGRYSEALTNARMAYAYEALAVQVPHRHIHHFYEALASCAVIREQGHTDEIAVREQLRQRLVQFEGWAQAAPAVFGHKLNLLLAEQAVLLDQQPDAIRLYDEAINIARQHQDYQYWAVACECAARFHMDKGRTRMAEGYIQEAYEAYGKWEARRKCAVLQAEYGEWLAASQVKPPQKKQSLLQRPHALQEQAAGHEGRERMVGLETPAAERVAEVIKASFTLTQRFSLQEAYKTMTGLIFDGAEAVKGCLVACRDQQLRIELLMHSRSHVHSVNVQLEQGDDVPRSLVQYTARLGESVQLASARHDELFRHDPYIVRHQCEAVCCLPVFVQEQLAGLLFLEVASAHHALSMETISTLSMIAAQMLFLSRLVETLGDDSKHVGQDADLREVDALTERELEVLELMAAGLTNKEIAIQLGITAGTVKVHTHNIFSKLNVDRRMKAIAEARKMNLLDQ